MEFTCSPRVCSPAFHRQKTCRETGDTKVSVGVNDIVSVTLKRTSSKDNGWRDGGMEGWRDGGMEGWRE